MKRKEKEFVEVFENYLKEEIIDWAETYYEEFAPSEEYYTKMMKDLYFSNKVVTEEVNTAAGIGIGALLRRTLKNSRNSFAVSDSGTEIWMDFEVILAGIVKGIEGRE